MPRAKSLKRLESTSHAKMLTDTTPARTFDEVRVTGRMLDRTRARFGLVPQRLAADTAYGTGRFLGWLVKQKIAPHIPVWDMSAREDGTFSRADFVFDRERDQYTCPGGKLLKRRRRNFSAPRSDRAYDGLRKYRAAQRDCRACDLKGRCCPNMPSRNVLRSVHEDARDQAHQLAGTPEFARSRNQRKKVEMLFAHLKTTLRFERMRLRGLSGARDEFLLAAVAQNLRRMVRLTAPSLAPAA